MKNEYLPIQCTGCGVTHNKLKCEHCGRMRTESLQDVTIGGSDETYSTGMTYANYVDEISDCAWDQNMDKSKKKKKFDTLVKGLKDKIDEDHVIIRPPFMSRY